MQRRAGLRRKENREKEKIKPLKVASFFFGMHALSVDQYR